MLTIARNNFFRRYLPLILSVILLVAGLGTYFIINNSQKTEASWFSSGAGTWNYRQKIVIDHTKVSTASSTTLSNFPVLISTTNVTFKSYANGGHVASSTGADILFTDSTGTTKLNHEIEKYVPTTGELEAWVNVPSLSPTTDTVIYMYYGGPSDTSQQNATGVWSSNYLDVWHMNQDPNGSAPQILDSASSPNNGNVTILGGTITSTSSQVGLGVAMTHSVSNGSYIEMANTDTYDSVTSNTVEAWVEGNSLRPTTYGAFFGYGSGTASAKYSLNLFIDGSNHFQIMGHQGGSSGVDTFNASTTINNLNTTFHHLVYVSDATGNRIYVDGVQVTPVYSIGDATSAINFSSVSNGTSVIRFGITPQAISGGVNGIFDEIRVSNVVRSADWIATEYNNQSSPSTFHSFAGEESRLQTQVNGGWYNASWQFRKKITINHEQVSGTSTLSNFPVLVSFTNPLMKYTGSGGHVASSTGGDILFTSSNGVLLNFEREYYASTTGQLISWVQIPTLSPTADTVIYLYYGNASATDQQNVAGTWDSNFKGVWHMPNGTTLSASDSTGITGGANNGATAASGKIDGGASFNGSSSYIGGSDSFYSDALTVCAWINPSVVDSNPRTIVTKRNNTNEWSLFMNGTIGWQSWGPDVNTTDLNFSGATTINTGTWYYACAVQNGANNQAYLYLNGAQDAGSTQTSSATLDGTSPIEIGNLTNSNSNRYWNGSIDEVRVSNIARSASWVATEYNNQNSPSTFETVAGEESQSATTFNSTWYSTAWTYRKPIVIDHNKVNQATGTTTPLTNFPVLVSLTDNDLENNVSATGADILFTSSDGLTKLNYERELYASSTGQLIAWVQVPSLSSQTDTVLYMYFGNSSATDQQSASATWDSNFKGVWHLPNGTTLSAVDSTGTDNGTLTNGPTAISGQIDGGASFASTSLQYINLGTGTQYNFSNTTFTVGTWFKRSSQTGLVSVIANCLGTCTNGGGWAIDFSNDAPQVDIKGGLNGSADIYTNISPVTYTDNNWHNFTAVITTNTSTNSGNSATMYIDGNAITGTSATSTGAYVVPTNPHSYLARREAGNYYNGSLDEPRISNTARSADWIKTEYLNQSSPSTFTAVGGLQSASRSSSKGGVGVSNRSGWYNTAWANRMAITISHNMVGSSSSVSLSNFPVLISTTSPALATTGNGGGVSDPSGNDILFTDSDGITRLNHEIETYVSATGQLIAWVKIPALYAFTDKIIYIYYGNSGVGSQQNASGVWDSNFKGVYHMTDNAANTTVKDSTGTANGTNQATTSSKTTSAGSVGNALTYNGSTDFTTVARQVADDFTLCTWFNTATAGAGTFHYQLASLITSEVPNVANDFGMGINISGKLAFGAGTNETTIAGATTVNDSTFHYGCATRTKSGGAIKIYVDGRQDGSGTGNSGNSLNGNANIKFADQDDSPHKLLNGTLDEIRISNTVRSADWIKTEYLNESNPGAYETWGSQVTPTTSITWGLSDGTWTNRKTITIDHTKVSTVSQTTLSNFPVLISVNGASGLTDNDFKTVANGGKMGRDDGLDMKFTLPTGYVLPYELEKYSSSTGETIAWVQVPSLSPTADTQIYVYLGNSSASDQSNSRGVWDSNYAAVQHLPDGTTLTANDSTSNANNASTVNGTTAATGKIDGGASFSGSPNAIDMPDSTSLDPTAAITTSLWFNGQGNTQGAYTTLLIHEWNNDSTPTYVSYALEVNRASIGSNRASLLLGRTGNDPALDTLDTTAGAINTNGWNYVVGTWDGSVMRIYVNGVLNATTNRTSAIIYAGSKPTEIGGDTVVSGSYFKGLIDEARISNVARSADWIKTEYNNQNSPSTFYSITGANTATRPAATPFLKNRGGVKFH